MFRIRIVSDDLSLPSVHSIIDQNSIRLNYIISKLETHRRGALGSNLLDVLCLGRDRLLKATISLTDLKKFIVDIVYCFLLLDFHNFSIPRIAII